ncbi:MAG TPA: SulP family inorganic anion transporter [Pyrinomonadaceae bacterium]|nr:SulP family inorganic anion transporter [Pyrinomonadaceae bacterium]
MADSSLTVPLIQSWLPGIHLLRTYDTKNLSSDVVAGLSVAAVAIPIGIAYAQLAGAPPQVGIYSCFLAPVAYALFGSSRQLIVNPDAAACAIVAATTAPLAAGDAARYADLSILLTLFTGVVCIAAGIARFGFIANFLSRPILVGYLNGIAISIIAGQLGKLIGIDVASGGVFRTIGNLAKQIATIHWTTALVGLLLLALLLLLKRFMPKVPGPLVAAVVSILAVYLFSLSASGVRIIGTIPSGLPSPHVPSVVVADLGPLALGAMTIMLVSFCSMMTTARGFATKNGYRIDPNRDLMALGVCDLASGFTRGFVVSGADSRTAVADSAGGKTQMTSVVTSIAIGIVLLFLTAPLAYLPSAALAAILISSSIGLFDFHSLRRYYHVSKPEFRHSMVAMLGVMTIGVLGGVVVAVGLAILRLLMLASKPHDAVLGVTPDGDGFVNLATEPSAKPISGVVIYRFDASLLFFNADYFASRVRQVIHDAGARPSLLVLDAESISLLDITGAEVLETLRAELDQDGIQLRIARSKGMFRKMLERSGVADTIGREQLFGSVRAATYSSNQRDTTCKQ